MALVLRAAVRTGWLPRVSAVLSFSVFFVECTGEEPARPAGVGSSSHQSDAGAGAGSRDHEGEAGSSAGGAPGHGGEGDEGGEAGSNAGGVGGRDDSSSEGGAPEDNAGGDAGSPSQPPPGPGPLEPEIPLQTGLPCEVQAMLRDRCQSCHSSQPVAGGGVPLLMYADLIAESKLDPTVSVAARALKRIKDSEFPMPPSPVSPPTSAEIAALEAWVQASTPVTYCDAPGPNEPNPDPDACTSKAYWTGGTSGSPWMMPGRACIACHKTTNGRGPLFAVAGTLYPTAHERDTCYGVPASAGAVVIITDANGVELPPIPVSAGGNFFARWSSLAVPYRAKVVVGDSERVMLTPQTNGDCNACHTRDGAQGASGRITSP